MSPPSKRPEKKAVEARKQCGQIEIFPRPQRHSKRGGCEAAAASLESRLGSQRGTSFASVVAELSMDAQGPRTASAESRQIAEQSEQSFVVHTKQLHVCRYFFPPGRKRPCFISMCFFRNFGIPKCIWQLSARRTFGNFLCQSVAISLFC